MDTVEMGDKIEVSFRWHMTTPDASVVIEMELFQYGTPQPNVTVAQLTKTIAHLQACLDQLQSTIVLAVL